MPIFGPNTLGTLVIIFAAVLLIVVVASAPYHGNTYFLITTVTSDVSKLNQAGVLKMGVFGYCIYSSDGGDVCPPASVGYALDPKFLFGVPQLPQMIKLSDTIIKTVTKALVLHALGAMLAILSAIAGLVSHIEEFSKTCWTSCLASLSATTTLVIMIFDLIFFSIVRARINAMSTHENNIKAELGNAIYLTILAWLCLAFSGCFFCAGRCLCSFRRPDRTRRFNDHVKLQPFEAEKGR